MYRLSVQYAFLADRTGGSGLTWSKLAEPGNGMISVLLICCIESLLFLWAAYYLEQVGAGWGQHLALVRVFGGCRQVEGSMLPT